MTSKDLKQNYKNILQDVENYQQKFHQLSHTVDLIAVSKNHSIEKILDLYNLGQQHFAENYLQEAVTKISQLNNTNIIWHYIGRIQSNKTKPIAENFSWVHSIDKLKIAERLSNQRPCDLDKLNILIQVNLQNDLNKSGVSPEQAVTLTREIINIKNSNLTLRGFMCILKQDKQTNNFKAEYDNFIELQKLLDLCNQQFNLKLDTLSMGMSNDYPAAIAAGSTMIRIGTKLFGARKKGEISGIT